MHSFIVPNPFLKEKYTLTMRRYLLSVLNIESILHFDETNVFDEVSRLCIVYVLKKGSINKSTPSNVRAAIETEPLSYTEHQVEPITWLYSYNSQIRTDKTYLEGLPLLSKINRQSDSIGQHLYVNVGATLSSKEKGRFDKSTLVSTVPIGNAKKFFTGENVSRWRVTWEGEWLDYRQDEMSGPRSPEMFETLKIIIRTRTAENERLICAYEKDGLYCNNTAIVCCSYGALIGSSARLDFIEYPRSRDPLSALYILTLLNSKLGSWIFRMKFATSALQGTYSDVWPQSIRAFPVRKIKFPHKHTERDKLERDALSIYYENDDSQIFNMISENKLEDPYWLVLVYHILVKIVSRITDDHQNLPALTADFWTDLEGASDPATYRKLRDKGKQEAGLAQDPALARYVNPDSKSTRSLDESLAWDEAAFKAFVRALAGPVSNLSGLLRVWQTHAPRYRELVERIDKTDWLIDQIVYKLYGLTEEEIAIVEGRS